MLNAIANDNDSHSRAPTPRFAFFHKIGARAPVRKWSTISNVARKCVTALVIRVIVYILARGRQCKNEVVMRRCFLRQLYSAKTNLSSLFCDFGQIRGTVFRLLKKAPKTVWKWRRLYSTWAILSSDKSNLHKFVLERPSLGGCAQIVEDFGRLVQINLDTLRSCPAPGN